MTIEAVTVPIKTLAYTGPDDYAFTFMVLADADLVVNYVDTDGLYTLLVQDTDYTLARVAGVAGGTVSASTPADTDGFIEMTRVTAQLQEIDWENNGAFSADILERALDRLTLIAQENKQYTKETGLLWTIPAAGDITLVAGNGYMADTTSVALTYTLPAAPVAGDKVGILDIASNFTTNNLTIDRNGKLIMGAAADLDLDTNDQSVSLIYSTAANGWRLFTE